MIIYAFHKIVLFYYLFAISFLKYKISSFKQLYPIASFMMHGWGEGVAEVATSSGRRGLNKENVRGLKPSTPFLSSYFVLMGLVGCSQRSLAYKFPLNFNTKL